MEQRKLSSGELNHCAQSFSLQSMHDVLPGPANLHTWGLADTSECNLCQRRATLKHILSCCPKVLGEGRSLWRHNQVLKALADSIGTVIQSSKTQAPPVQTVPFIREGKKANHQPNSAGGLLATARECHFQCDLERQHRFSDNIATTSRCPYIISTSVTTKQVVLLELTVPLEQGLAKIMSKPNEQNTLSSLQSGATARKPHCELVEVRCRGFAGHSLQRAIRLLVLRGLQVWMAIKIILEDVEKASWWSWICRGAPQCAT